MFYMGIRFKFISHCSLAISSLIILLSTFSAAYAEIPAKVVSKLEKASVYIIAFDSAGNPISRGSGFFISQDGHLITNYHVWRNATIGYLITSNGKQYRIQPRPFAEDAVGDLVCLKADIPHNAVMPLSLELNIPKVGEDIIVVGNPRGLQGTFSQGIVSAIRSYPDIRNIIQFSAPASPGSSGGPVVNKKGMVVGVASAQRTDGQNLNFAVPSERIKMMLSGRKASDANGQSRTAQGEIGEFSANDWIANGEKLALHARYEDAVISFTRALEMDTKSEKAYISRGNAYSALNKTESAIQDYNKALEINPRNSTTYSRRCGSYLVLGNHRDAIKDCNRALEIDPNDTQAYLKRGYAYWSLKDYKQSINDFDKVIERDSKNDMAYQFRGYSNSSLNQYERGISDYSKAIALGRNDSNIYANRAYNYQMIGNKNNAMSDADKAIELNPKEPLGYFVRGGVYYKKGNLIRALDDFKKCIALDENYALAYAEIAQIYNVQGNSIEAIRNANRAIELSAEDSPRFYYVRGLANLKYGNYAGAEKDFDVVVRNSPKIAAGYIGRGLARLDYEKYRPAIYDLNEALKYASNTDERLDSLFGLALCHFQVSDYNGSKSYFDQALVIEPRIKEDWSILESEKGFTYSRYHKLIISKMIRYFSSQAK